jgi:hypothetical protein
VALKPRAHQNGKFGILSACVIVQAHHAQHPLALVVDGNEGHGAGRIVVDELVEQFVAHFAKRREEAQPNASGNDSWWPKEIVRHLQIFYNDLIATLRKFWGNSSALTLLQSGFNSSTVRSSDRLVERGNLPACEHNADGGLLRPRRGTRPRRNSPWIVCGATRTAANNYRRWLAQGRAAGRMSAHHFQVTNSSSNALASFRSSVSCPSVNQP